MACGRRRSSKREYPARINVVDSFYHLKAEPDGSAFLFGVVMKIRTGSLDECIEVANAIPEFLHKETVLNLAKRLQDKVNLVLIAEDDGNLLGFKIGYELDKDSFYSWFGGVLPEGRKRGVAQLLMEEQEKWARKSG